MVFSASADLRLVGEKSLETMGKASVIFLVRRLYKCPYHLGVEVIYVKGVDPIKITISVLDKQGLGEQLAPVVYRLKIEPFLLIPYTKPVNGIPDSDLTEALQLAIQKAISAYQKPSGGIPSTDMAEAVRNLLTLAGSAYQKPEGGIPAADADPRKEVLPRRRPASLNPNLSAASRRRHSVHGAYLIVTSLTRSVSLLHRKTMDYECIFVTGRYQGAHRFV